MYYFMPLCVAVLLHRSAALEGCNDTCSSILASKSSGNFDVDCNRGLTAEYFKCISATNAGCDNNTKSIIVEQNIAKYYPSITGRKRGCELSCGCAWFICWCYISCSWKRGSNDTAPLIPLMTCSNSGLCVCNNNGERNYVIGKSYNHLFFPYEGRELNLSQSGSARDITTSWALLLLAPFIVVLS